MYIACYFAEFASKHNDPALNALSYILRIGAQTTMGCCGPLLAHGGLRLIADSTSMYIIRIRKSMYIKCRHSSSSLAQARTIGYHVYVTTYMMMNPMYR